MNIDTKRSKLDEPRPAQAEQAVSPEQIESHYRVLNEIGCLMPDSPAEIDPEKSYGFARPAFSSLESEAIDHFVKQGEALGLEVRTDSAGNTYIRTPWKTGEILQVGSHLDTIRAGGNYDGAAGIVAGFEAIKHLVKEHPEGLAKDLELAIWRGEESAYFGKAYLGSTAALNGLSDSDLARVADGVELGEAIRRELGESSYDAVASGAPVLDQEHREAIKGYLELHIEQQTVLEKTGEKIGIVTSIRAPQRYQGSIESLDGSPLDGIIVAEIISSFHDYSLERIQKADDLVQTVGVVSTGRAPENSPLHHCGISSVAGYAEVRVAGEVEREKVESILEEVGEQYRVSCSLGVDGAKDGLLLSFTGRFDHSGATPMGSAFRSDANVAAAKAVIAIKEQFEGVSFRFNYPKESDRIHFQFEARSNNGEVLRDAAQNLIELAAGVSEKHGVSFSFSEKSAGEPLEALDSGIQEVFGESCSELGIPFRSMPSGAGHDVAVVAKAGIPSGLLFIPCKNGISHNPEEFASSEDMAIGGCVLAASLKKLAS